MNVRRSARSVVNTLLIAGATAFLGLAAAQSPDTPSDPLLAGFKSFRSSARA